MLRAPWPPKKHDKGPPYALGAPQWLRWPPSRHRGGPQRGDHYAGALLWPSVLRAPTSDDSGLPPNSTHSREFLELNHPNSSDPVRICPYPDSLVPVVKSSRCWAEAKDENIQHIEKWQEFIQPLAGILVIFHYVLADIILYSKSLGSAKTVKFWPSRSSQCGTLQPVSKFEKDILLAEKRKFLKVVRKNSIFCNLFA